MVFAINASKDGNHSYANVSLEPRLFISVF